MNLVYYLDDTDLSFEHASAEVCVICWPSALFQRQSCVLPVYYLYYMCITNTTDSSTPVVLVHGCLMI